MSEMIRNITTNVLIALYRPFGFAVIMSILIMFFCMFAHEKGLKSIVRRWRDAFKNRVEFRCLFWLVFYTTMILFRTLLNRDVWMNPLSDVIGIWGLKNVNGELSTEVIENLILFIPFTIFLFCCFKQKLLGEKVKLFTVLWISIKFVFLFTVAIEFLQLLLRLGTFQLSDMFYNTIGGGIGGLIYWCGYRIKLKQKRIIRRKG